MKLVPILLDEMEESVCCLVSIIYNLSEEQSVSPDGLSGADPENKEFIKELSEERTRDRDGGIRRELIGKPFKPESIKLANQLSTAYKNDNVV
jgi:hypothetical protein